MKKLILIALIAVAATSCKKDSNTQIMADTEPKVTDVKFYPIFSGGAGNGLGCDVTVSIPVEGSVKSLRFAKENALSNEGYILENPQTGILKVHQYTASYPHGIKYYFVFKKQDGTEVKSDLYTVD